jgi:hypothetical protein
MVSTHALMCKKVSEGSTISHQVTQRAWCGVLGSTSLPSRPAHVQTIHKATHGLQRNFEHPQQGNKNNYKTP